VTIDLPTRRRVFAEEIEAVCGINTPALVEAFATIARERFLGPGPWILKAIDGDPNGAGRRTADSDPARVYHNVPIAIDPARQLFNGQPATVASWIDTLAIRPGERVLHVGAGLGYYTAVIAHCVGTTGAVVAYEIDGALASAGRDNLRAWPNVCVVAGDAAEVDGLFDAMLINVGTTHAHDAWVNALGPGGRLLLPLTVPIGPTLGKGFVVVITRKSDERFAARAMPMPVAIYSAGGVRDDTLAAALGSAMKKGWPAVTRFRRDPHEPSARCWYHTDRFCFDAE